MQAALPEPLHAALAAHLVEATWILLPHESGNISANAAASLRENLKRATSLLIGPGLGSASTTRQFFEDVVTSAKLPLIVDADGLRHLAQIKDWPRKLNVPAILTPHPGEMSALSGLSIDEIEANRLEIAREHAIKWGHVVVLKGAFTVVAAPSGDCTVIPIATSALARAGSGDVLAGLIVGLRAQEVDAFDAAIAAAFIHGRAGLLAAERIGTTASVLASDVLASVPAILAQLERVRDSA